MVFFIIIILFLFLFFSGNDKNSYSSTSTKKSSPMTINYKDLNSEQLFIALDYKGASHMLTASNSNESIFQPNVGKHTITDLSNIVLSFNINQINGYFVIDNIHLSDYFFNAQISNFEDAQRITLRMKKYIKKTNVNPDIIVAFNFIALGTVLRNTKYGIININDFRKMDVTQVTNVFNDLSEWHGNLINELNSLSFIKRIKLRTYQVKAIKTIDKTHNFKQDSIYPKYSKRFIVNFIIFMISLLSIQIFLYIDGINYVNKNISLPDINLLSKKKSHKVSDTIDTIDYTWGEISHVGKSRDGHFFITMINSEKQELLIPIFSNINSTNMGLDWKKGDYIAIKGKVNFYKEKHELIPNSMDNVFISTSKNDVINKVKEWESGD